jgi:hypothetical protein
VPMTWFGWGAARDAVLDTAFPETSEVLGPEDGARIDRLDPSVG